MRNDVRAIVYTADGKSWYTSTPLEELSSRYEQALKDRTATVYMETPGGGPMRIVTQMIVTIWGSS